LKSLYPQASAPFPIEAKVEEMIIGNTGFIQSRIIYTAYKKPQVFIILTFILSGQIGLNSPETFPIGFP
jgi:hypothetical protein